MRLNIEKNTLLNLTKTRTEKGQTQKLGKFYGRGINDKIFNSRDIHSQ